jgi:hypothetical protein
MTESVQASLRQTERPQSRMQAIVQYIGFEEGSVAPGSENKPVWIRLRILGKELFQHLQSFRTWMHAM